MENYKDKVTKGKAEVKDEKSNGCIGINDAFAIVSTNEGSDWHLCAVWKDVGTFNDDDNHYIESKANATLIAESFNVLHDSGYTPSELLAQRNELLDALKSTKQLNLHLYKDGTIGNMVYNKLQQAIINATK